MRNYIGLRTIKTGISVCLSVIVSNLLALEYPFFVCMTAIISMDKTVLLSLKMGRNRVFGTICGATLGLLFQYIDAGNPLLCGLGIILLIVFLNKMNMTGAIGISGIVFCAMMVHLGDKSPILYGIHRTLDSFIGASITLFVNMLILPYYNVNKLDDKIEYLKSELEKIKDMMTLNQIIDLRGVHELSNGIAFDLDLYMHEIMSAKKKQDVLELCAQYSLLKDIIEEMEIVSKIRHDQHVFDYHMNQITHHFDYYYTLLNTKNLTKTI